MAYKFWCVFLVIVGFVLGFYSQCYNDEAAGLAAVFLVVIGVVRAVSDPSISRHWE